LREAAFNDCHVSCLSDDLPCGKALRGAKEHEASGRYHGALK
jgi:hypothetical protein